MALKHCRECGVQIHEDATKCEGCGGNNVTPATFSFWCLLSMMGGMASGAAITFVVLRMNILNS